jgi:hypothetical protein
MLVYALIVLSLSLAGAAALQMMYMIYLERMDAERKKRVHELERRCIDLDDRLQRALERVKRQERILGLMETSEDDHWAEVIDDR